MCPPHSSVLFYEDRREFFSILHELRRIFMPANSVEAEIINDMADARWAIKRAKRIETGIWNRAAYHQSKLCNQEGADYDDEIINLEIELRTAESVASNPALRDARRQVRQLGRMLTQLEKRLADLRKNFAGSSTHELHDNAEQLDRELAVLDVSEFEGEVEQDQQDPVQQEPEQENPEQDTATAPETETETETEECAPPQPPTRSQLSAAKQRPEGQHENCNPQP